VLRLERALLSWSGGKDSTLAMYELRRAGRFEVVALITTVTRDYDRVSMHGVRRQLLERQAEELGIGLEKVWIPKNATNKEYESQMRSLLEKFRREGVRHVAFGDIFLQDIRQYREERLREVDMDGIFPIWGRDTTELAHTFIDLGFKAIVCCADPRVLDKKFCGAEFDGSFLSKLPPRVDPCGERGEFHTFVYAGPLFRRQIGVKLGEVVLRDGFYFADILPD
jgi:uncharacterized protein (TIGR00290 family)